MIRDPKAKAMRPEVEGKLLRTLNVWHRATFVATTRSPRSSYFMQRTRSDIVRTTKNLEKTAQT
jgi:hypothetical protein